MAWVAAPSQPRPLVRFPDPEILPGLRKGENFFYDARRRMVRFRVSRRANTERGGTL